MPMHRVQRIGHELLALGGVDGPARVPMVPPGVHRTRLQLSDLCMPHKAQQACNAGAWCRGMVPGQIG